jgi:uncharacterized protein YcbK (DUF882 family)
LLAGRSRIGNFGNLGAAASRAAIAAALIGTWLAPNSTESAVANGDTRTVVFSNDHTGESGSFTYMVNGVYDQGTLDKLNWFLRDWRLDEPTKMDPHLFDIVWEVYRESGSKEPIDVLSAYRSPQTNAMLRRRSRQVAEHSQHMEGRAIDAHFTDVGTARIRDIAMRMQSGGVGFYPTGAQPWVHIDSGSVRYWPRMSRDALTRLFPDGKTVFIPSDGQPMPGYEQARAEIEARGGEIQVASGGGLFAWLFGARGGGEDDAEEMGGQLTLAGARGGRTGPGPAPLVQIAEAGPEAVAKAKRNLPTGPTYASAPPPAPAPAAAPVPTPKPEIVAALEEPKVETDASSDSSAQPHAPNAALYLAPMPPRRPSDLNQQVAALANFPLPPVRPVDLTVAPAQPSAAAVTPPIRPADLVVATAPETTGSTGPLPAIRPANLTVVSTSESDGEGAKTFASGVDLVADVLHDRLPKVITRGIVPPARALALTETPAAPNYADDALLARAAALSAPLPPMPIPNVGAPYTDAKDVAGTGRQSADLVDDVARLFGTLPFNVFKPSATASGNELRGGQQ